MHNVTLKSCIESAYNVQDFQIVGALSVDRFDIAAKAAAPETVPALRAMMGTLLAERFKLAFHRDVQERKSLDLVVAKGGPKLHRSEVDAAGVLRPTQGAMVAEHGSMKEFVSTLSGPLRTPVVNKTGLTGRYDFTVDLSSYPMGEQPDMTAIVMSALREQLGLSLVARKEKVEILVIEHVEKIPTAN